MPRTPRVIDLDALRSLHSTRLRFRPPEPADAEAVFAYAGDERVCRFLAWPCHTTKADTLQFLRSAEEGWHSGEWLNWVIEANTGVVGMIAAQPGRAGAGIGYVLAHDAWGRGYAGEALMAVSTALFESSSLRSLWAFCVPENIASVRVLEKCGFNRDGLLPNYFACPNLGGKKHDVLLYVRRREV